MSRTRTDGSVMVVGERFEAWCSCPACERFACHLLRAPKPKPEPKPKDRLFEFDKRNFLSKYGDKPLRGAVMIAPYRDPIAEMSWHLHELGARMDAMSLSPEPLREWEFEVIRMCECGNEWGQT